MNVTLIQKPLCVDIISETDLEPYFPIDKKGNLIQKPIVKFIEKRGYFFDLNSENWYILMSDGLYHETDEKMMRTEIYKLLRHNTPEDLNITTNFVNSIVDQVKSSSNNHTLQLKFEEFLYTENGMNYDIPLGYDGELIPMKNGILNTSNMELLPNCGYLFFPCPYNIEYSPIPEGDLFASIYYDTYLDIITDPETLNFYLWWVGMVLFSETPEQLVLFLYGRGGTGKSSLASAVSYLLGSERVSHAGIDILSNPHGTAILENKRLNVSDETEKGNYSGLEGIIKNISGEETITINPKNRPAKTIKNTVNLLFLGNSFLDCDMSDAGLMRRIKVIECDKIQKWEDNIPKLLKDNEFLNWLFNVAHYQWIKNKNVSPDDLISLKMRDWFNNVLSYSGFNSWIFEYCGSLDDEIVKDKIKGEIYPDLYRNYRDYVEELGCSPLIKKKFAEKLYINYRLKYSSRGGKNIMVGL